MEGIEAACLAAFSCPLRSHTLWSDNIIISSLIKVSPAAGKGVGDSPVLLLRCVTFHHPLTLLNHIPPQLSPPMASHCPFIHLLNKYILSTYMCQSLCWVLKKRTVEHIHLIGKLHNLRSSNSKIWYIFEKRFHVST